MTKEAMSEQKTEKEVSNPADRWLDGQISMAKMLSLLGVDRSAGEIVVGAIWQALDWRVQALLTEIQSREIGATKFMQEALTAGRAADAASESGRRLAYRDCRIKIKFRLGECIKQTGAGL